MKNRKFDIVTLSDHNMNYDKLEQWDLIGGVIDVIGGLFGGGGSGGRPGDWDNRVRAAQSKAAQYGVAECIDQNNLQSLLMMPSGWQAAIDQYFGKLKSTKTLTGSCIPGQVLTTTKTTGQTAGLFPPGSLFDNPLVLVALGAGAVFFLTKKK